MERRLFAQFRCRSFVRSLARSTQTHQITQQEHLTFEMRNVKDFAANIVVETMLSIGENETVANPEQRKSYHHIKSIDVHHSVFFLTKEQCQPTLQFRAAPRKRHRCLPTMAWHLMTDQIEIELCMFVRECTVLCCSVSHNFTIFTSFQHGIDQFLVVLQHVKRLLGDQRHFVASVAPIDGTRHNVDFANRTRLRRKISFASATTKQRKRKFRFFVRSPVANQRT